MKINKNIINFARKHPFVSNIGYNTLKIYWSLKSIFVDYNHTDINSTVHENLIIDFNKNRPYGPKKRICYAPFNNMHFQINGDVSACSFNYDFILGNVNKNSIKEIWNGENANAFREKLGNINFEQCKTCENVLKSKNYNAFPPLKYDMFADDHSIYPTQMSFEMSDLCNFECTMCNENFSSLIRKRKGLAPQKNSYSNTFFDELLEFIPYLKTATFIGGEPLLIKSYFRIWEDILRLNKHCTIHIQTNASILPPRFIEMLDTGQFDIGISLDATNKSTFECIRINSNFDEIEKNVLLLKSFMDKRKVNLNINFCPLISNWHELPTMVEFCNNLNIPLKIVNVENPRNLSLQHKNSNFLHNIIQKLEVIEIYENGNNHLIRNKNISSYKQFVKQLNFIKSEALRREQLFIEMKEEMNFKFIELFNQSSLLNNFSATQREQLKFNITKYIDSLSDNTALKVRIKFRIYYSLYQFKHTSNGVSSTDFNTAYSILENVALEFYKLETDEIQFT